MAIHELREYEFTTENWPRYAALFADLGFPERKNDFGRLCGAWHCESVNVVDGVRFFHLWEYDSLDHRAELRRSLLLRPRWTNEFLPTAAMLVHQQTLSVLNPIGDPLRLRASDKPVVLSRFKTRVGQAARVLSALGDRRLARWTTEFPDPNQVIALDRVGEWAQVDPALLRSDEVQEQLQLLPFPWRAI